jgi:hypothetical protein
LPNHSTTIYGFVTQNPKEPKKLDDYTASTRDAIDESAKKNYEITRIVRHEIIFSVDDNGLKIIQDSFSDQASDNHEGTDIVYWENSQFYRIEPDMKD